MSSDMLNRMGTLFLDQAMDSAREGDFENMSKQVELHRDSQRKMVALRSLWINDTLDVIADKLGEEEVLGIWKKWLGSRTEWFDSLGAEGRLERMVARHNALGSVIKSVEEKEDRYVLTLDPCGSGGLMRRSGLLEPGRGITKKGYPWSWGRAGIPYYCIHCAVGGEIIPKEKTGKAWFLQEFPDDPEDVCVHNFLKQQ